MCPALRAGRTLRPHGRSEGGAQPDRRSGGRGGGAALQDRVLRWLIDTSDVIPPEQDPRFEPELIELVCCRRDEPFDLSAADDVRTVPACHAVTGPDRWGRVVLEQRRLDPERREMVVKPNPTESAGDRPLEVRLRIRPFTPEEAAAVSSWVYEAPFDVYDGDRADAPPFCVARPTAAATTHSRVGRGSSASAVSASQPGCRPRCRARHSGRRRRHPPDLVSQGIGTVALPTVLDFGRACWRPLRLRVGVATFNERSLSLCRAAGFAEATACERSGAASSWSPFARPRLPERPR